MDGTKLVFKKADKMQDFEEIYDHNLDVFSESPGFEWTYDDIKKEVEQGWELYSVKIRKEIIAAIFFKVDKGKLLTKNTALKMNFQGRGLSHRIKEFFEDIARQRKASSIFHYCRVDDFRAYSLNEGHGYRKTEGNPKGKMIEWIKKT